MPDQEQTLPIKLDESIQEKVALYVPKMETGSRNALASLQAKHELLLTAIQDFDGSPNETVDAAVELATGTMIGARKAYDKWNEWRTEITGPLDEFKKRIMEFEKVVAYDGKTDNYYTKLRSLITQVENKKLKFKADEEERARKKKELENYKVDLATQIRKNLTNMLLTRVKEVDEGSRKFWEATTLDTFESRARDFTSGKIKLKQDTYDKCFIVQYDQRKIDGASFLAMVEALKAEETYDIWSANVAEAITPTVNEWRAKVPAIKEQMLAIANEKDAEAKAALEKKKKDEDEAEATRKQAERDELAKEAEKDIESEATMNKMQNEFVEQVSTQALETSPTKKVYVVADESKFAKAFCNAVYHALSHKDFPGIYKRDKGKKIVTDPDTGAPQIMEHAKWFFDFVAANCDTDIEGMELRRIAKVTIRQ